ncbi:MAG TPA: DUF4034 domain-containing protein [Candidatus Acidoferrum sp.]
MAHNSLYARCLRFQAISLFISTAALIFISCGHSHAAPQEIPISTLLDAIAKYGQGQSYAATPPAVSSTLPLNFAGNSIDNAPEDFYPPLINALLTHERFEDLEMIAAKARAEKSRHSGGIWVIKDFYEAVATPLATPLAPSPSAQAWDAQTALINKWVAAFPRSATARISLANLFASRAWDARGHDYADSVDDKSWETFYDYMNRAKSVALDAAALKDRDPYWFDLMMQISLAEGWDSAAEKTLFELASAFEPSYYHYYRAQALYLLPRWHGEEGEMEAFAEQTLKRLSEPTASMMYFDIVTTYACGCMDDAPTLHGASWPKLKEGYENLVRLYKVSSLKANRYAYLTYVANDKAAASEAFKQLGDQYVRDSWKNRMQFETARAWALNP